MNGPLVTILIPTYDRADLLFKAIASAVTQTYRDIEVIILDDASPDDGRTAAASSAFLADPRVRYIRHPTNIGIAASWRVGIGITAGAYFCLLHDDDSFEPTFVAELLQAIDDDNSAVIAFCDHWVTDLAGRRDPELSDRLSHTFGRDRLTAGRLDDFARAALIDTSIPIGATLFRRSVVKPDLIDSQARGSIDMWLLYGCIGTGLCAVYVPQRLMNYRAHAGGMSNSQPLYMTEGHLWRYEQMLADPRIASVHADLKVMSSRTRADYGLHLLSVGRVIDARLAFTGGTGRKAMIGRCLVLTGRIGSAVVRLTRRARGLTRS